MVGMQPAAAEVKAKDQLKKANEGARARDHVFDGRKAPPPAVRANPAPKPNPVGQPVYSTRTTPGYKPAPPRMKTINVPSPTVSKPAPTVNRSAPVVNRPAPTVSRSTTTASSPTVSRSTTTTTTPPPKR